MPMVEEGEGDTVEETTAVKYRILEYNPKFDGGLCPEEEREKLIRDLTDLLTKRERLILILDFSGISFVVPSVVSMIYHLWRRVGLGEFGADKYIVLSGLGKETKLAIEDRLNAFKDFMLAYEDGRHQLIGKVDGSDETKRTLEFINKTRGVTYADLREEFKLSPSAASTRLKRMYDKRIIYKISGNPSIYTPVVRDFRDLMK